MNFNYNSIIILKINQLLHSLCYVTGCIYYFKNILPDIKHGDYKSRVNVFRLPIYKKVYKFMKKNVIFTII
jgi:hypothetical protein